MFKPRLANNNCDTFETFALTHFDTVYRVAMLLTRNSDEAQDLVQETYYKAYRSWDRFELGTNVRAWLLTILRHTHISAYRKRTPQLVPTSVLPVAPVDTSTWVAPEWMDAALVDVILRHLVQDEVKQAISELPELYRLPVLLADLAECSYQEIATVLGCPVGTVMSRLFRGRQQLRTRLHAFAQASGYIDVRPPHVTRVTELSQASEPPRPSRLRVAS